MDTKERCQSCAMPIGEGFYGSNADGSPMREYCKMCFVGGHFAEPDLTLEGMIAKSVGYMTQSGRFSKEEAEELSRNYISKLKRWNSPA